MGLLPKLIISRAKNNYIIFTAYVSIGNVRSKFDTQRASDVKRALIAKGLQKIAFKSKELHYCSRHKRGSPEFLKTETKSAKSRLRSQIHIQSTHEMHFGEFIPACHIFIPGRLSAFHYAKASCLDLCTLQHHSTINRSRTKVRKERDSMNRISCIFPFL